MKNWVIGGLLAGVLLGQTVAAEQREVAVSLQQFRVHAAGQAAPLGANERVLPGEVIEYRVVYRNVARQAVRQVVATLPVPKDTEYVAGSAAPAAVEASLDGVKYAPLPLRQPVQLPGGAMAWREVPLAEYRSLRWKLGDLAVGQQAVVVARVRLAALNTPVKK